MSEQLPQNKNEQNDNSAFDPDLYQDFDAEAGLQADLAAFNSRMDEIRTNSWISNEEMRRGRQEANEAQLTYARLQLAQARREGASNEELVAKAKDLTAAIPATNKYDIVAQDTSGKSEPSERKSLLDDLKERPLRTSREGAAMPTVRGEDSTSEPESAQSQTATPRRKRLSDRFSRDEETRTRDNNTREAKRRHAAASSGNSIADDLIANPLPSTVRVKAAEEAKVREAEETPESKTETQAATTSSEDQPGNVPAEPKERRRHAAPKGRQAKVSAPVAAAPANTVSAPAQAEPDSDSFFGSMTQNMTAEGFASPGANFSPESTTAATPPTPPEAGPASPEARGEILIDAAAYTLSKYHAAAEMQRRITDKTRIDDVNYINDTVEAGDSPNQDSLIVDPENKFMAVFDGMGGHAEGAAASQKAREVFMQEWANAPEFKTVEEAKTFMRTVLQKGHAALEGFDDGRGTTAIAVKVIEADGELHAIFGNAGDSIFRIRHANGKDQEVNHPQYVKRGGRWSGITNCLGGGHPDNHDSDEVGSIKIEPGSRLFVYSDGIAGDSNQEELKDNEFNIASREPSAREAADYLMNLSLDAHKKVDDKAIGVMYVGRREVSTAATAGAGISTGEWGSFEGDDYDFDSQGNNTAAAPDTSANPDDAFAHLFRTPSVAPEAPTTYTTPLDVVATPGENTATGRALVTDAMNKLGKNFETGYAYDNTAYFVHNRRTDETMVIHISNLDDPDYLESQLEGIKDMNERGMTRREKVAYKIGNLASRVANSDRMQKIESRWDRRRAGIQTGEGVMVDMTPDIEALRGDRTRSDARRAEHIARKEERAEVRRQRLEDEPSFYKRHRKALIGTLSGLILADAIAGGIAANNAFNHDDHHNTAPRASASPTPDATHSASPSARPSATPSASSSESTSPSATTSPTAETPSATPTSPTVNPIRPNAPEGGQGGSGVITRNEQHAHENLTFVTRDGKQQVTATLKEGGTIFEAGHDAGLTDTQIMNAVQRAGITEAQAASLTPNQIVDFTPNGNSYEVKLR